MSSSLKFEVGDLVTFNPPGSSPAAALRGQHPGWKTAGIVIEHRTPRRDWRFKHRLPMSGVRVMWSDGQDKWSTYAVLERVTSGG